MQQSQTLQIHNEFDAAAAKNQVQEMARAVGFGILDRACIVVATSSLIQLLGLGWQQPGQLTVESWNGDEPPGVRVVCAATSLGEWVSLPEIWSDLRALVDNLRVETLAPDRVQVTAVKWLDRFRPAQVRGAQIV